MLSVVRLHDLLLALLIKDLNRGITAIHLLQILGTTNAIFVDFGYLFLIGEVSVHFQLALLECLFSLYIAALSRGASLHVVLRNPLD